LRIRRTLKENNFQKWPRMYTLEYYYLFFFSKIPISILSFRVEIFRITDTLCKYIYNNYICYKFSIDDEYPIREL